MGFLENLYKELILDHYRRPRNRGRLDPHSHHQEAINPSCGDELELYLQVEDGVVTGVSFEGEGCAISQASASLMTEAVRGRSVEGALDLSRSFKAMIHGEEPNEDLGDLRLLQGVSRLHARVKCATLAWLALDRALADEGGTPEA